MANRDLESSDEMGSYVNSDEEEAEDDEMSPYQTAGPPQARPHNDDDGAAPARRQHKYTTRDLQPERPWMRYFLTALACLVMIVIMVLLSIFLQKMFDPPEDEDWNDDTVNITDDDQAGALSGESMMLPRNSEFLDNVCAEDKLSGETRATCEQVCAPAMDCCSPYAGNSTCFEDQVAGCVTYSQCHALEGTNDPAHNDLDRVCSMDAIEVNREECELACTTLSCCYTDVDSCVAINFQACLDYSPCQNLRSTVDNPDDYIPAAGPTLDDQCRDGDNLCGRGCREATCCSDPNSDCFRDNFVSCLTYSTCNQFPDSTAKIKVAPIHSRVEAAPANLRDVCLESYVASNGRTECQTACASADCCFAAGSNNCFGDDPLGCMEYRGCRILAS